MPRTAHKWEGEARQLRVSVSPRLVSRDSAAGYMGVGVTKFDEMVRDGRAPKPLRIDSRVLWDVHRLDAAIDALAGADDDGRNDFDD